MDATDLALALEWAAQEGWNPGLDDAEAFLATDPDGFLVRKVNGRPVAAISVVNHADDFAFLGLYLCHPDFRGQGHGLAVWRAGLAHAGDRTVGLDGVPAQQANYETSGFVHAGATTRFEASIQPRPHPTMRRADAADIAEIVAREAIVTGTDRAKFLNRWTGTCETRLTMVCRDQTGLRGYGTVRQCREGMKVGPFLAQSKEVAMDLLGELARFAPGKAMIDVPESSSAFCAFLDREGWTRSFQTARMYLGKAPDARPEGFHAVATLELG